ncbi:MAG: TonB family protein, partial [Bacteroidota bacterium]
MAKKRPTHISRPVYPGGVAAMKKFVAQHLKYPSAAVAAKVEGTVIVRYGVDYRGKVTDTKVKKGIGHGCD